MKKLNVVLTSLVIMVWLVLHVSAVKGQFPQLGADIDGGAAGDQSGYSDSLSSDGSRMASGAILNDDDGTDSGHFRMYKSYSTK